jgi:predicted transposase/invertase (TIGR01784 family)
MAFLTRHELLDQENLPSGLDSPDLKKALTVLEIMNFSPIEREVYEEHLKWFRIEANTIKKAADKAREEGKIEGKAEGKIEVAKNLLKIGVSVDIIASSTGLTATQIEKLKSL